MHGLGNCMLFHFKIWTVILILINEQLRYNLSDTVIPCREGLAKHNFSSWFVFYNTPLPEKCCAA